MRWIQRMGGFAATLLLLPAMAQEGPPRAVTLEQALTQARARNSLLAAANAEVSAKEGQFREARSLFLPDLALTETWSRTDNPVYVFMGKLTQARFTMQDFALDALNHPAPLTNWQTRVEMTAPLFTGGKLRGAYRATSLGIERARAGAADAESQVVRGVTEAFYGSLLAARAAGVMEGAVETARAHREQVEAMHGQGLVLDSDLMRVQVFLADLEQQAAARRADAEVARAYLAYAMGEDGDVEPRGDLAPPAERLPDLGTARAQALTSRPDLKATSLQSDQAGQGVKMAKADYVPQVGLVAAWEQDTHDWSSRGKNWQVGVQMRLPLFDGGARAGRLQTAKAQELQARMALEDARRKVGVEVQEAWLRARAAQERVAVTRDAADQARENQRIVALRYSEGMAALTDLLDADTAVTVAELTRSQAVHDLLVERARLAWATGAGAGAPAATESMERSASAGPAEGKG